MNEIIILIAVVLVGLMLWVRLAPTNPARWHTDPASAVAGAPGGVAVRHKGGDIVAPELDMEAQTVLRRLQQIALATPRTSLLAGSPQSGRMTFVTRSQLWGFPDYTTIAVETLPSGRVSPVIHGRLRFGRSDLGVNRKRVLQWLEALSEA